VTPDPERPERPERPARRWPGGVYDHGTDPDPRLSLANERTFLAWTRTALALLAGAAALEALDLPLPDTLASLLAALLAVAGTVVAGTAWWSWARVERAVREGAPLPGNPAMLVVLVAVAVVGAVLVVSSLVRAVT
jgi:inner membrane protein YidH